MLATLLAAATFAGPIKKVLIIGVDGLMPSALKVARTPNFDALIAQGAISYEAQSGDITVSGPGWSSMLTGVWREKHGVDDNAFKAPRYDRYPHLFRRVKEANPRLRTASIVAWTPINEHIVSHCDLAIRPGSDPMVAKVVAETLEHAAVDIVFVHLDACDGAGHSKGYGAHVPEYVASVETADRYVGTMLAGLKRRPTYAQEDWLILSSTDHGGQGTGHGPNTPECRTIYYLASGPSASRGVLNPPPHIVDVATTALAHLGVPIQKEWNLDGQVRGLRR